MENETKKTEQLIQIYKEDPIKGNLKSLVQQMEKTVFLIPAVMPDTPEARKFRKKAKENRKEQLKLTKEAAPIPSFLKNKDGIAFLPIYTRPAQIPKEPKFDVLMNMPFHACRQLVLNGKLGVEGLVLNPFSDNLIFQKNLLEAIRREEEGGASGIQQIQATPAQLKIMLRQKAEFCDFPIRVYREGADFIQRLSDEKEAVVDEVYRNAYQQTKLYSYGEEDFSVMPLDISDELLLVRVDAPAVKASACLCHRIYITLNPKNNEIHYFTIEQGKEKGERNLGGVDKDGKHLEYGSAPVEGAEISHIMGMIQQMD